MIQKKALDSKILEFINEHFLLTFAAHSLEQVWCASCFYVYDSETFSFYFSTDPSTLHGSLAVANASVAANIVLETETIGKIQGLQLRGTATILEGTALKKAKKMYLKRFPYAILKKTTMWALSMEYAKFTDNRLGFGTKLIWE